MTDGYTTMQSWIVRLRQLKDCPEDIAKDIAPELKREFQSNIAAVRSPDGTPWKPTRAGHAPLQGARRKLSVKAVGTTVIAVIQGIHARHHFGWVRGGISRPILPGSDLPKQIVDLVTRVAMRRFRRVMRGS